MGVSGLRILKLFSQRRVNACEMLISWGLLQCFCDGRYELTRSKAKVRLCFALVSMA
jgi:hypothetical protein